MPETSKLFRSKTAGEARRKPPRRRLSFEEFLEWPDEDNGAERVDGVGVLAMTPGLYVRERDLGEVFTAPFLRAGWLWRAPLPSPLR